MGNGMIVDGKDDEIIML